MQNALLTCVEYRHQRTARRFLSGLSRDELEYIADFVGTCVIERRWWLNCSLNQVALWIRDFALTHPTEANEDDKTLLLFEFLSRCVSVGTTGPQARGNRSTGSDSLQLAE